MQRYGVDVDEEPRDEPDPDHIVVVPATPNPLTEEDFMVLTQHIDPLQESQSYGIDLYTECLNHVTRCVTSYQ